MDPQTPANELEVVAQAIPFKIFSGLLRAHRSEDGRMRLRGVASSTVRDRHGDLMTQTALRDMETAAKENLTIFLNHSYNVPEDVAGSVENAVMLERGYNEDNSPIWDLDFDVVINDSNPRAVDAFNAIEKGTKLGLSIGAMIPEGGAVRNKKTGTYIFNHVDLLETSIVGIPANPRSWVSNAVKALKSATTTQLGTPTLTLDGDSYRIEGKLDQTQINIANGTVAVETKDLEGEPPEGVCGEEHEGVLCTNEQGHEGGHSWDDSGEPQGTAEGVAPDVTDAKIQVITIDTDDPEGKPDGSQGASGSDPDTEPDDDVYDSAQPGDVSLAATLTDSLGTLEATANALVETRRQLDEVTEERDAARRERDEVAEVAQQVIASTSQIIEKLASMPVGRKAVIREAKDELSGLERLYGPEIVKLLRSKTENG